MSILCLKVEAFAGTTIEEACRDLCALADRVGILCEIGFNGVKVWAYPGTDPAQLAKAWDVQMKRPEHIYRIASARPSGVALRPTGATEQHASLDERGRFETAMRRLSNGEPDWSSPAAQWAWAAWREALATHGVEGKSNG